MTNVGNGRFDTWLADGEDAKFHRIFGIGLVGGGGGNILVPGGAKAWEMTPDGLNWTFTAQDPIITFQNGDILTVDDLQFTADKIFGDLANELEAKGYYEPRDTADGAAFEGVTMGPGENQFTVTSFAPRPDVPFFLSENAQGPQGMVQPKAYTMSQIQPGDLGYEGYERAPIGAGSMKPTNWVPEQRYEFERYEDYFWHSGNGFDEDRRVKFQYLTMEVVPEDATRAAALQGGQADLVEANILMTDNIEANGGWISWADESAYNWVVMVDCWEPDMWCYDKRVRQAVQYAVDLETIVGELYGRGGTVKGWNHVTPNALGYSEELDPYPYDLEKANALLAEAGIANGKMANGEQVSFKIYTWEAGDTPLLPELSQLYADAWRDDLGFDVEVVVGDASATRQQWNNRQLPGHVLVRTNEARYDGTSSVDGGYNNVEIAWRAVKDPDLEPWYTNTTVIARKALNDLGPTRDQSFNEAYKVMKDDSLYWSGFYTNLPWGVSDRVKEGSYQPWPLVSYLTAIWTLELE
jgi:ABC-type transport system substrate-binding protein